MSARDISEQIRLFAEEPDGRVADAPPPARRIMRPGFLLMLSPSPTHSTVSAVRTTEAGLDDVIAEARAIAKGAGFVRTGWFVGPSCRPDNLAQLLLARGFFPATAPPFETEFTVMVLTTPPPPPPPGVEARMIDNVDEYVAGIALAMKAFEEPPEVAAEWIAAAPKLWADHDGIIRFAHMAYIDGRAVGYGFTASGDGGLLLGGSGVLADARGRGAYRALIAARWQRAVELGKPALVVHAGAMSRPILERCGFQALCTLKVLEDPEMSRPAP